MASVSLVTRRSAVCSNWFSHASICSSVFYSVFLSLDEYDIDAAIGEMRLFCFCFGGDDRPNSVLQMTELWLNWFGLLLTSDYRKLVFPFEFVFVWKCFHFDRFYSRSGWLDGEMGIKLKKNKMRPFDDFFQKSVIKFDIPNENNKVNSI